MAQMKKQNKTPVKELSKMEIADLSNAEFKTVVIKTLRDLTEYGKSIRGEMKAVLGEKKRNIYREPTVKGRKQGTNSERKESLEGTNDLEHKEEINV